MTAETAVTLPVVVLCLAVLLAVGAVTRAQVSCVDAARSAARALARGESPVVATGEARAVLARPAAVSVASPAPDGPVEVTVRLDVHPPGVWSVPVTCRARAWREPTWAP
ncbi:TadE family type IV pilus minor pilin [Aquipuribacter nitratireducens]|uniref:TadE family type IV pilus minor pilin n=1 Tax=Aquipuribacter nitratireducens TaxID=650104 RepID=A0ABW0GS40_9MICO